MITFYNHVTKDNYKRVIKKMEKKGYGLINNFLPNTFPKLNGDVFLKSWFNPYKQTFESLFTTRAIEKQSGGVTLPSGDKKLKTFIVDNEPTPFTTGLEYDACKWGLWSVKTVVSSKEDATENQEGECKFIETTEPLTTFEALKKALSPILGDLSKKELDELPFIANRLEREHKFTYTHVEDWGTVAITVTKTSYFRLRNEYNDWYRPMVIDRKSNESKELFFDFSFNYDDLKRDICKLLSIDEKELEHVVVYLPYCTEEGSKTGEMLSTYTDVKTAYNASLLLEKLLRYK